jgi:hypothetical protein
MKPCFAIEWQRRSIPDAPQGRNIELVAAVVEHLETNGTSGRYVTREVATIAEHYLTTRARDVRAFHQGLFWVNADRLLATLSLTPEARKTLEASLSATVPRPNPDWALWAVTCIPRIDPKPNA